LAAGVGWSRFQAALLLGGFGIKPFVYQNIRLFQLFKFDAKGLAAKPEELSSLSSSLRIHLLLSTFCHLRNNQINPATQGVRVSVRLLVFLHDETPGVNLTHPASLLLRNLLLRKCFWLSFGLCPGFGSRALVTLHCLCSVASAIPQQLAPTVGRLARVTNPECPQGRRELPLILPKELDRPSLPCSPRERSSRNLALHAKRSWPNCVGMLKN
jgi:hypothetical protein